MAKRYSKEKSENVSRFDFSDQLSGWDVHISSTRLGVAIRKNGTTIFDVTAQEAENLGSVLLKAAKDSRKRAKMFDKTVAQPEVV